MTTDGEFDAARPPREPDVDPAAFFGCDLRVGRIVRAEPNAKARKPALCLWIDLGPLGEVQSSAQITDRYAPADLVGRRVIVAANLGPRRIAGFRSDVLVLGATDPNGAIALLGAETDVAPGSRVH